MSSVGKRPSITNKITPGIKKLWNGELFKIEGNPPSNLPDGEIINAPPPPIALTPRKPSKNR